MDPSINPIATGVGCASWGSLTLYPPVPRIADQGTWTDGLTHRPETKRAQFVTDRVRLLLREDSALPCNRTTRTPHEPNHVQRGIIVYRSLKAVTPQDAYALPEMADPMATAEGHKRNTKLVNWSAFRKGA